MGCTYDTFEAQLTSPEQARQFFKVWHEKFDPDGEHDYYGMEGERLNVYIDAAPLFKYDDQGDAIRFLVLTFLKKYPKEAFWGYYRCTYSGSAEELEIEFEFDANQLTMTETFSDPGESFGYCEACDETMEVIESDAESTDQEIEYKCPNCGASHKESVYNDQSVYNIRLVGSKWKFPKGMRMPELNNVLYRHGKKHPPFSNKESAELVSALQEFMPES